MDSATGAGIPVVVVQQVAPETSAILARGGHGFALHEVVASLPHNHLVEKTLPATLRTGA